MIDLVHDLKIREKRLEDALFSIIHQPPADNAVCRIIAQDAINHPIDYAMVKLRRQWAAEELRCARTMRRMAMDYGDKNGFYARSVMRHMRNYMRWREKA